MDNTKLCGVIAVDDTIMIAGTASAAGSRMLEHFIPPFDAEAITRVKAAGGKIAGRAATGEFGLDVIGETCYFDAPLGDAAKKVAAGDAVYALNVDLDGAPRRAAAVNGVTFIKPTYGTVSRVGVIPCACSGEQVGVTSKTAAGCAEMLTVIAGHDKNDGTSLPAEKYEYGLDTPVAGLRVGIIKELLTGEWADEVTALGKKLRALGAAVSETSLPEVTAAQGAWQILLSAEACNNLSRYDGVKFGYRTPNYKNIDELYTNTRTEAFGLLAKATILYGSDVLSKGRYDDCYDIALRTRRVVRHALDRLFAEYDVLLAPACSKKTYDKAALTPLTSVYDESIYTALASISGIPAVVTGGVQLIGDTLKDALLLSVAAQTED